jgi:hypothetical protein
VRVPSLSVALSFTARKPARRPDCVSRSGAMRFGVANARSKNATLPACVTTVAPSAAAARSPPE